MRDAPIRLSGPTFRPKYIELDGGLSSAPIVDGKHVVTRGRRHMHYFVTLVEEDGARLGLWDGADLSAAIRESLECRREFGIEAPVRDLFGGRDFGGAL